MKIVILPGIIFLAGCSFSVPLSPDNPDRALHVGEYRPPPNSISGAVVENDIEATLMFLDGCSTTGSEYQEAAMHSAVLGRIELMSALLEKGMDPDIHLIGEQTPLHMAVVNDRIELVSFLLSKGADPNSKAFGFGNLTPTQFASKHQHEDVFKILYKAGGDLQAKDSLGNTIFTSPYYLNEKEKENTIRWANQTTVQ